jgi:CRP/FNR family transcriptional regulator, cyclic AMP receptor protein
MQSATDLGSHKECFTGPIPCDAPSQDFQEFEEIKLSYIHPRGAVLFAEGQSPTGVYLLRSGRAKVSISSSEGRTVILRIAQPGDLLGVNSVLKGQPYETTVEMLERCRIDFIPRVALMRLLDRSKSARIRVSESLGNELSDLVESARSLFLSESVTAKLTRLLIKWCDEFGEPTPDGIRINHGLTQQEIAEMICASRETVSRLLTWLKDEGIVRLNGTSILVRNRAALELVAQ